MLSEDPTTYDLRIPSSADEFEEICLDLWQRIWTDPNIQRLGSSGQNQHGIDIYSRADVCRVIQCKRYWRTKLTGKDIDEIVSEVKTSPLMPISELIIATTQPRDARIQEYVETVARQNVAMGLFDVHIYSWDDIRSLLRNYPEVLRLHYPGMFGSSALSVSLSVSLASTTDVLLDDVKDRLTNRDFSAALEILDSFEKKQPVMDNNIWFRVLTNRGVILSRIGKYAEAGQNLLQAYVINKTNVNAGTNAAQACLMMGDNAQAVEIARAVIKISPASTLAYRVLVLASSSLPGAQSMLKDLPESITESGDVLFALGLVAERELNWDQAVVYLQRSLEAYGRNDPTTCADLAAVIMEKARRDAERDPEIWDTPSMRTEVNRAQELLSIVIDNPGEIPQQLLSACYTNRCRARIWLDDVIGATQDAETCVKREAGAAENKRLLAVTLYMKHDADGAIRILRSIEDYREAPEALDMLARLLDEQKDYEGALDAVARFLALPDKPPIPTMLVKHFRIRLLLKLNRAGDAQGYSDDLLSSEPGEPLWIADACWCSSAAGLDSHDHPLCDMLEEIITLTTPNTPPIIRDQLSEVMDAISRPDLAIQIDRVGFSATTYGMRARRLLHHYLSLGRFADAKDLCDRLIQSGVQKGEVHWYRAQLHVRAGALSEAESDLEMCLSLGETDTALDNATEIRLLLAEVQLENQHPADALRLAQTLQGLPILTTIQFDRLIALLIRLNEYSQAMDTAYNRLFDPDHVAEADTYLTYMRCFFTIDRFAPEALEPATIVGQDSGVLLQLPSGEQAWYVQDPVKRMRMGDVVFLLPADQLWQNLLGKTTGDTVDIKMASSSADATASIVKMAGRYAVILNECFTSFARQFPDRRDMERVPLTSPNDSTSISEQFRKHIADAAAFGLHVRRILTAQRNGVIPLSAASRLLARNCVELLQDVAAADGEYVLATKPGYPPKDRIESVTTLVMDPLSSVILSGIPAFNKGVPTRWSLAYTRTTLDTLVEASLELRTYVHRGMKSMVSLDGEHFAIVEASPEIVQQRLTQVDTTIAWLQEHASIAPCSLILEYGEEKYQQVISVVGRAEAESIALAREPGHALVSDELLLRSVAASEKAASLSSQDVLRSAYAENLIKSSDYAAGMLHLYKMHIRGVYFDSQTTASVCELAHWNARSLPPGFLNILAADNMGSAGPSIAGKLAHQIFMNVQDGSVRCSEWWPVLLGAVASGRKAAQAFQAMMESMDAEFHHVVTPATSELGGMAAIWLKTHIAS